MQTAGFKFPGSQGSQRKYYEAIHIVSAVAQEIITPFTESRNLLREVATIAQNKTTVFCGRNFCKIHSAMKLGIAKLHKRHTRFFGNLSCSHWSQWEFCHWLNKEEDWAQTMQLFAKIIKLQEIAPQKVDVFQNSRCLHGADLIYTHWAIYCSLPLHRVRFDVNGNLMLLQGSTVHVPWSPFIPLYQ